MENNELLQAIGQMISDNNRKMTEDISSIMENKLEPINNRLDVLERGINEVKERTVKIEIALENDISRKLGALFDGHQLDSEQLSKLDTIEKTVEETKSSVDVIFKVVQDHSGEIKELKLAK
jgi:hypothetical protein